MSPWQCSICYCPLLLCTTFIEQWTCWSVNPIFVAPSPLGKMCTQPIWSFPALFNSTDSKSFSLLNFQNLKRKNTWILISIAFTKKSEKWTVRFKAQRVQVIYRMHWHQMRWGSPHKDIDIPWPKPKQHHCQYQWDNVNMWMPPSMIHICCKKKRHLQFDDVQMLRDFIGWAMTMYLFCTIRQYHSKICFGIGTLSF